MAEPKSGMAAVAATHDDDQIAERDDDQLGLPGIETPAGARPIGRPKGAKNRKTRELLDALGKMGQSPLEFLFRAFNTGQMVKADGELVELEPGQRLAAAQASLPYWHEKQPVAIQADGKLFGLVLHGGLADAAQGGDEALEVAFSEVPEDDHES